MIWIKFKPSYPSDDLSADSIASLFDKMGDFQVYKVTKKSIYLQFYFIDKSVISDNSLKGVIEYLGSNPDTFHIEQVLTYAEAPKFKAHNRLE